MGLRKIFSIHLEKALQLLKDYCCTTDRLIIGEMMTSAGRVDGFSGGESQLPVLCQYSLLTQLDPRADPNLIKRS